MSNIGNVGNIGIYQVWKAIMTHEKAMVIARQAYDAAKTAQSDKLEPDAEMCRAYLKAMHTWQPIKTAPKCFIPPISNYDHYAPEILGRYGESWYYICSWGGPSNPFWVDDNHNKIYFQPSHWMPIPE